MISEDILEQRRKLKEGQQKIINQRKGIFTIFNKKTQREEVDNSTTDAKNNLENENYINPELWAKRTNDNKIDKCTASIIPPGSYEEYLEKETQLKKRKRRKIKNHS